MAVQISTNVEFIQANTTTNAGFILLPSTTRLAGRLLTIKDTAGTFFTRPLTLSTIGNDRFEEGVNLKRLVEPFGYITLASDGVNRWYTIDGTSMNTYTISTLTNPISISTQSVFTSSVTVSTLGFEDRAFNTVSSFYTRSTLLYLGSNIIGGSKCGPTQFIPIRSGAFQPNQIAALNTWLDAADTNTFTFSSGNSISRWFDKSLSGRSATQTTVANQPVLIQSALTGKPCVFFTAASTVLNLPGYALNTIPPISVFLVGNQTANGMYISITGPTGIYFRTSFGVSPGPTYTSYGVDYGAAQFRYVAVPANLDSNFHIQSFALPNAAVGVYYFDGSLGDSQTGFTFNSASFSSALPSLGAYSQIPGNNGMTGFISEILIYRATLNTTQIQQIEGYLAWKWGLQGNLPATHPFKTAPP
jgi:hypothetical protein